MADRLRRRSGEPVAKVLLAAVVFVALAMVAGGGYAVAVLWDHASATGQGGFPGAVTATECHARAQDGDRSSQPLGSYLVCTGEFRADSGDVRIPDVEVVDVVPANAEAGTRIPASVSGPGASRVWTRGVSTGDVVVSVLGGIVLLTIGGGLLLPFLAAARAELARRWSRRRSPGSTGVE